MSDFFSRIIDPFVKRNKWSKSQQQKYYARNYNIWDRQNDKYGKPILPASTEMDDVTASSADFQVHTSNVNTYIYKNETEKNARISTWREMSKFPEISFALGEVEDEAVNFDANNEFLTLDIKNDRLSQNENIVKNLVKEWKYIIYDVMEAHKQINEWFADYMVDGEIFFEKIVDPQNAKEGIRRIKRLLPEYTFPIWEEIESEKIFEFYHKGDNNIIIMPPEMVAYANSGIYFFKDRFTKVVMSYLENAKVDYRKLKQLEDALVIYRLVRAPERRVFNIEVGNLPKGKAEAYVQGLMRKYRQRKTYDPSTGEASQQIDTMAMIEDFWLPSQNGKGSKIDTLPGGEHLGQIEDVMYFLDKLYRALRIPMSRMKADTGFSLGDTSDITREEVRFNKMVQKFTRRFANVFLEVFLSHIRLKGYADEYGITAKDFSIKINSNNLFEDFLETSILTQRAENFERFISYAERGENGEKPLFSKRWLMKRFLKFSPEEIISNDEMVEEDVKKGIPGGSGGGGGGGSGLSSLGGGGTSGGSPDIGSSEGGSKSDIDTLMGGSEPGGSPKDTSGSQENKETKPNDKGLDSFAQ